ncbi:MAG TPA: molecular chaperone TorD family protein [Thermoplasmata archaeon]|nr:molecular chaperone TorD family protein [Thermoplasmata archaeon]
MTEPSDPPHWRRAQVLSLLAAALRPPIDSDSFRKTVEDLSRAVAGDKDLEGAIHKAAVLARDLRADREYHRLFMGPGRPPAPPFESVYRGGLVFGPAARDFLLELRRDGLEPVPDFRLPPDHISLELEYLAHLECRAVTARAEGRPDDAAHWDGRAREFVDRHLARWIPDFRRRLDAAAPDSPYALIARAVTAVAGLEPEGR